MLMIAEFKAYLHALGDDYAFTSFTIDNYRHDGFGDDPAFAALIAESEGCALGYAIYAFEYSTDTGKRNVFLHNLFVSAEHRGKGIALGDARVGMQRWKKSYRTFSCCESFNDEMSAEMTPATSFLGLRGRH